MNRVAKVVPHLATTPTANAYRFVARPPGTQLAPLRRAARPLRERAWNVACRFGLVLLALWLVPLQVAASGTPVLNVRGMTFVASQPQGDSVVLHAETARFDTDAEVAYLIGVEANVPVADEKLGLRLRCDEGEVDLASNDFLASGNVQGRTDGGRHFTTKWVRYDHQEGALYTDAPVVIAEEGTTYRGGGFRYLIRDRRFRLMGGASVIQEPKAASP